MTTDGPDWTLDDLDHAACVDTLAPLFEGAPRFLSRLCAARPFGGPDALFERARTIAQTMPEDEQFELVDAHPRLGAPPGSVSASSFREQGYDRVPADGPADVASELASLNASYEARFGFRYCVFVGGRSREELLPGMVASLEADRPTELRRALDAVVDIARDRYLRATMTGRVQR